MAKSSIVIMDDDPATRAVIEDNMPPGFEVRATASIDKGFDAARAWVPELIVLSADAAGGFKACRRFKKDPKLRSVPLIFVSRDAAAAQFEDHAKLPTRADEYMEKPLDPIELTTTLARLLLSGMDDTPEEATATPPPTRATDGLDDVLDELDTMVGEEPPPARAPRGTPSGELLADLEVVRQQVKSLEAERTAWQKRERELTIEVTHLTERVHNLHIAHTRVEQAHGAERARYKGQIESLEARVKSGGAPPEELEALRGELRRLKHLNADMAESLEVIYESLQVSMEIVERHRELAGGTPSPSSEPAALALPGPPGEAPEAIALGGPPASEPRALGGAPGPTPIALGAAPEGPAAIALGPPPEQLD